MSKNVKLPNLVIAGVTKAGTTSLFMYLKLHPDVCASNVKETCYFLPVRYGTVLQPIQTYKQYFKDCSDSKYIMEATPGYFYGGRKMAETIRRVVGNAYVIVVLREPISRMLSFYKYLKSRLLLPAEMGFGDYVKQCKNDPSPRFDSVNHDLFWGIEGGFYDEYLPEWADVFGARLKIILFDDVISDPRGCMKDICAWLGLDDSLYATVSLDVENRSIDFRARWVQRLALGVNDGAEQFWRRFPTLKRSLRAFYYRLFGKKFEEAIPVAIRDELDAIFRPHNERLTRQMEGLGYTKFPSWLKVEKRYKDLGGKSGSSPSAFNKIRKSD